MWQKRLSRISWEHSSTGRSVLNLLKKMGCEKFWRKGIASTGTSSWSFMMIELPGRSCTSLLLHTLLRIAACTPPVIVLDCYRVHRHTLRCLHVPLSLNNFRCRPKIPGIARCARVIRYGAQVDRKMVCLCIWPLRSYVQGSLPNFQWNGPH